MKLLKNLIVVLFAAAILSACGGGSSPEDVVMKFQKALLNMDYGAAKKYVVKDMHQYFDKMEADMSSLTKEQLEMAKAAGKSMELVVTSSKISDDGNTATVTVQIKKDGAVVDESDGNLVKEDGEWKIKN